MDDDRLVAVVDLAAGLADPQAEVDVLERVEEAGVEAADALEGRAADQHAGAGHGLQPARAVDRRVLGREARRRGCAGSRPGR